MAPGLVSRGRSSEKQGMGEWEVGAQNLAVHLVLPGISSSFWPLISGWLLR